MGAMVANAPAPQVKSLAEFGLYFGLAFQLIDDCLDYLPGPGGAGKDWGRDINEGKVTLPLLIALKSCTRKEREKIVRLIKARARNNSSAHPLSASTINTIRRLVQKYQGFEYTRKQAQKYTDQAKAKLHAIHPASKRKLLLELSDIYLNRQS